MHNLLITVSVFVSVMQFCICRAQPAQTETYIYIYCTVRVITAAKQKVIYIKLGDSMRKMGTICSSSNHFKCEILSKLYRGFPALEMIIKKLHMSTHTRVNVCQNAMCPGNRTFPEAGLFTFVHIFMLCRLLQPFVCFIKQNLGL